MHTMYKKIIDFCSTQSPTQKNLISDKQRAQAQQTYLELHKKNICAGDCFDWSADYTLEFVERTFVHNNTCYTMNMADFIQRYQDHYQIYAQLQKMIMSSCSNLLVESCYNDTLVLYIPAHTTIDTPYLIPTINEYSGSLLITKLIIIVEPYARVQFYEKLLHKAIKTVHSIIAIDIIVHEYAQVDYYVDYTEAHQSCYTHHTNIWLYRESKMHYYGLLGGNNTTKMHMQIHMLQEQASASIQVAFIAQHNQKVIIKSQQNHYSPHTFTDLCMHGVIFDRAMLDYQGKIIIDAGATNAHAEQINKNLLMHATAHAQTMPILEVLCNEVFCTHGSAVGQCDPELLFYLQSRGFCPAMAYEFLIRSFFAPLFTDLSPDDAHNFLNKLLAMRKN